MYSSQEDPILDQDLERWKHFGIRKEKELTERGLLLVAQDLKAGDRVREYEIVA